MTGKITKQDLILEIKTRREVIKRLGYPIDQLVKADAKERLKREKGLSMLSEYQTVEEAQDAYGYGFITSEEYEAICDALDEGRRSLEEALTPVNLALDIIKEFKNTLEREINVFEYELLPDKEKERINSQCEARQVKHEIVRRERANG